MAEPAIPVEDDGGRAALGARIGAVRRLSESLAAPLSAEDQQVQTMDDVSPTKWHLAHVSWFFETFVLGPHAPGYEVFHPRYGYIFNSYYEGIGPRHARPRRGALTRPPLADVMHYRRHVDDALDRFVAEAAADVLRPLVPLIVLGLNHEQQHQELLLTDIKHVLASQPLHPAYRDDLTARAGSAPDLAPQLAFVEFMGGEHVIGADGDGFCFDNETPAHAVLTGEFTLANRPVTNGEVVAFIKGGGYATATLWLADGWAWVERGGANMWGETAPMYWSRRDGAWREFTLGGFRPLDPAAPASHLSYYEADAIARFLEARLPTEAEWELACRLTHAPGAGPNLLAAGLLHPAVPSGGPSRGLYQMLGDVWEWTASAYAPYPGFRPAAGAVGEYNGKFMVSQQVLRGGSCATPPGHIRASYRNFFYPHQSWQFSGLRLAR
jgi:ergothioneine biosynthesis protein EgtB